MVYGVSWASAFRLSDVAPGIVIVASEHGEIAREVVFEMGGVRATDDLLT